ncbi:iron-sulfur cluster assembly scaffold protein [Salinispira pacifica]|uniref:Putative iron-sulfur cluster assembly scaffold protein for SUF system, SufE2 n=1 Tax=Salinispira pacifica TaxID=1307761 RepID=V5WHQ6_9SPIO|nr:iron-sulfur cluster assembly scaffold protein [Salinispira pacifica]AHC15059.1 Putative iron-sulfur cluster assembly scaffold protein for SUF system, SufE2 [Salinispira pacifica]
MDQEQSKNIIIRHYRERPWERVPDRPRLEGHEVNRSCGDELTLYVQIDSQTDDVQTETADISTAHVSTETAHVQTDGNVIRDLGYEGKGCSICIASADILCQELKDMPVSEARKIARDLLKILEPGSEHNAELPGDIPALLTLKQFPMRQKCATMGWKILLDITE